MITTPSASQRLQAVQMLSSNYRMIPLDKGNALVNFSSVDEAAELADEYGLKLCLINSHEHIRLDKNHIDEMKKKYDVSNYTVAVTD